MNRCPEDAVLHRLVGDLLPEAEQAELEAHLSACARCRERLEALVEVPRLQVVAVGASAAREPESQTLRLAMDRLTAEGALPPLDVAEPALEPTSRSGFLGRLGELEIRREVGRGGMGVVYEGFDPTLNRTVAVKTLSPHLLGDSTAKARFVREAQAAAALTHENVVAIHAISEAAGRPYLVLQFVEGESLAQRITRNGPVPFDELVRLGVQAARGLAAAHERGLVHRDIKPGNLMLDQSGTLRIADFGLARQLTQESITEAGSFAGTPAFMSPEQVAGTSLDARSDLFSLGVTLYYAASGVLPFAAESPFAVADQVRMKQPPPLREIKPALPGWFSTLVERLMEKDPARRPASAAAVADLLEQRLAPRALPTMRRWWVGLGAAVALLLGLAVIWQPRPSPPAVVVPRLKGFLVEGQPTLHQSLTEAVAAAPEGSIIEIHGDGPFVTDPIKLEGKSLTIQAAPGSVPRFEPSPATLAAGEAQFLSSSGTLRLEGLEIIWPIPTERLGDTDHRAVIASTGRMTLSRCRVLAGTQSMAVGTRGRELLVENCHIVSERGVGVAWQPGLGKFNVTNCIIEGRYGVLVAQNPVPRQAAGPLGLQDCTIVAERGLLVFASPRSRLPVPVSAKNCLWDCEVLAALVGLGGSAPRLANATGLTEALLDSLAWSEAGNVYRRGTTFLAAARAGQIYLLNQSDFRRPDQWLALWKLPSTAATEGTVRFAARAGSVENSVPRVAALEAATGPYTAPVGANPDQVGPSRRRR